MNASEAEESEEGSGEQDDVPDAQEQTAMSVIVLSSEPGSGGRESQRTSISGRQFHPVSQQTRGHPGVSLPVSV